MFGFIADLAGVVSLIRGKDRTVGGRGTRELLGGLATAAVFGATSRRASISVDEKDNEAEGQKEKPPNWDRNRNCDFGVVRDARLGRRDTVVDI